ncbi:MAG: hypothetical protein WAW42_00170 [Candidatus Competibacteraceae bacterium]|jgi:chorismate lyase/3-hydroxybenzoate synthase
MPPFTVTRRHDAPEPDLPGSDRLLAMIRFGEPATPAVDPRICVVPLTELGAPVALEVWRSPWPVRAGTVNGVNYADNGEVVFLHILLDEYAEDALQPLIAVAYRRLFATARALGYRYFLRIWNYFPDINQECEGLERYRAFCAGRHQALMAELADCEMHLPAACAIGTHRPGIRLSALAAREPGVQIENPRQVSAFHYPRQYGPRSPSFSRAVLKSWGGQDCHLYISGTASIVGHASQHHDLMTQLDETLLNLEALLHRANQTAPAPLRLTQLTVYCRPDLDPAPLRAGIADALGADIALLFLHADICRRELLVEIEGLAVAR